MVYLTGVGPAALATLGAHGLRPPLVRFATTVHEARTLAHADVGLLPAA